MSLHPFSLFKRIAGRPVLGMLLLFGQCVTAFVIPVFATAANNARSCAGLACGCDEDLKARNSCCCFPSKPAAASCCRKPAKESCCETPEPISALQATVNSQRCHGESPIGLPTTEPGGTATPQAAAICCFASPELLTPISDRKPDSRADTPVPPPKLG